jgi:hypothetical protein
MVIADCDDLVVGATWDSGVFSFYDPHLSYTLRGKPSTAFVQFETVELKRAKKKEELY